MNDCGQEVPPSQVGGVNGQDDYLIKHFASFNERKYQPHQDWIGQNSNMPMQLLTAEEKISEL
jgi:predicted PolB exonuclease-like 3'-5' exonuclease